MERKAAVSIRASMMRVKLKMKLPPRIVASEVRFARTIQVKRDLVPPPQPPPQQSLLVDSGIHHLIQLLQIEVDDHLVGWTGIEKEKRIFIIAVCSWW